MKSTLNTAPSRTRTAARRSHAPSIASKADASTTRHARSNQNREQQIRQIAYFLYQSHGAGGGSALDDWLQAEAQVDHGAASTGP